MGFKVRNVFLLKFEEDRLLDGLEVRVKQATIGDVDTWNGLNQREGETMSEANARAVDLLRDIIIDWNAEDDDGMPLDPRDPTTYGKVPAKMLKSIFLEWLKASSGVGEDLGKESSDGEPFPEDSIPMEIG